MKNYLDIEVEENEPSNTSDVRIFLEPYQLVMWVPEHKLSIFNNGAQCDTGLSQVFNICVRNTFQYL